MPLLATVDGVRMISTLLTDEQWRTLQGDVRAGRRSVLFPYCGRPAYLRTSKLGVRHFAHRTGGDCPSHPKESGQHLYVKNVILQAAQAIGWDAETEVRGDEWVADVLATNGARKVAFEVQWSAQTLVEYERRQARYAAQGIRCAWFTRHSAASRSPDATFPYST
jgi:competence protein CoiA